MRIVKAHGTLAPRLGRAWPGQGLGGLRARGVQRERYVRRLNSGLAHHGVAADTPTSPLATRQPERSRCTAWWKARGYTASAVVGVVRTPSLRGYVCLCLCMRVCVCACVRIHVRVVGRTWVVGVECPCVARLQGPEETPVTTAAAVATVVRGGDEGRRGLREKGPKGKGRWTQLTVVVAPPHFLPHVSYAAYLVSRGV